MKKNKGFSRRKFIAEGALGAMGAVAATSLLSSCKGANNKGQDVKLPPLPEQAPDGKPLRAGLIGCGGRGTGAAY